MSWWKSITVFLFLLILELSQTKEVRIRKVVFFPSPNNRDVHLVFSEIAKILQQTQKYSATFAVHNMNVDALSVQNSTAIFIYGLKNQQAYIRTFNEGKNKFYQKSLLSLRAFNETNHLYMKIFSESDVLANLTELRPNILVCDVDNFLCGYLAEKLNVARVIYYSKTMLNIYWMDHFDIHPGSYPMPNSGYTTQMNFKERVHNLINYYKLLWTGKYQKRLFKQAVVSGRKEDEKEEELFGVNIQPLYISEDVQALTYPFNYPPNFVPLGCFTCSVKRPLPNFLQQFLNQYSKVILVKFDKLLDEKESHVLVEVLSKYFKTGFILRGTLDENIETPKNIFRDKNGNSADILSLAKTAGFINDGDHSSFLEGVYFKKPMIVLPHNYEGQSNGALVKDRGMGIFIEDEEDFNVENFDQAVNEILSNQSKFKKNLLINSRRILKTNNSEVIERLFDFYFVHGADNLVVYPYFELSSLEFYNVDIILMVFAILIFCCYWLGRLGKLICGQRRKVAPKIKIELINS